MQPMTWQVKHPSATAAMVSDALERVVQRDAERVQWLRAGAEASVHEGGDAAAAARFQTMLELAYLVASADGFADAERRSLAGMLERITGSAVDHATLELHFADLDAAVELLGRSQRLARAAADLETAAAAEDALALVAMVALADGSITAPEHAALVELAGHVEISEDRVAAVVNDVVARVEAELR